MSEDLKPVRELSDVGIKLSSGELYFGDMRNIESKNIDFDVWLPSKMIKLQRPLVWTIEQKNQLILSIFMERKIPPVCVMSIINRDEPKGDDILQVIDGKQRLSAIIEFYNEGFPVTLQGNAYKYSELPLDYQMKLKHYPILCQMAYEDFDIPFSDDDKIRWFGLINFAGTPQDYEHMKKIGCEI